MFDSIEQILFGMFAWMTLLLGGLVVLVLVALGLTWSVNFIARKFQITWRFAVYMLNRDKINSMIMQLPNGEWRQYARRDLPVRIEDAVKERDAAYTERVRLLAVLAFIYESALVHDDNSRDPDWEWILFIEFPTGQASWHIKTSDLLLLRNVRTVKPPLGRWEWDGHSTETKYKRLQNLAESE